MKKSMAIIAIIVSVLSVSACGSNTSAIDEIVSDCKAGEGQSIEYGKKKTQAFGISPAYSKEDLIMCFGRKTGMPESIQKKAAQSTPEDGPQVESWDGYNATWQYSGDDGGAFAFMVETTSN